MDTRPMEFAGQWYPATASQCQRAIEGWLAGGDRGTGSRGNRSPQLGLAPHAGWVFSGELAAGVYHAFTGGSEVPLVVVLGGHLAPHHPIMAVGAGAWQTPFGAFKLHEGFRSELDRFSKVQWETPLSYQPDNSTELQLPFAKWRFPQAELLVLRVPPGPVALELGHVLGEYLSRVAPNGVVVASTDLTHYGPNYGFEPHGRGGQALRWVREVNDPAFLQVVSEGSGQEVLEVALRCHNACSPGGVAVIKEIAAQHGQTFQPVGYVTSADAGPRDKENFVGYLGGVFG